MGKTGSVSVAESKSVAAVKYINERGQGFRAYNTEVGELTRVVVHYKIPHQFLGIRWAWLTDVSDLELETPRNWILKVYGRSIFDQFRCLATDLAKEFDVHVHVKLVQERIGKPGGRSGE